MFSQLDNRELETLEYLMTSAKRTMSRTPQSTWPYDKDDPFYDVTEILEEVRMVLEYGKYLAWSQCEV